MLAGVASIHQRETVVNGNPSFTTETQRHRDTEERGGAGRKAGRRNQSRGIQQTSSCPAFPTNLKGSCNSERSEESASCRRNHPDRSSHEPQSRFLAQRSRSESQCSRERVFQRGAESTSLVLVRGPKGTGTFLSLPLCLCGEKNFALLRLLGDVQQHAHTSERHEQRRATVAYEGQRDAFGGHESEHHADVDEGLQNHHAGNADGEEASE